MTSTFLVAVGAIAIFLMLRAVLSTDREALALKPTNRGPEGGARQSLPRQELVRRIFSADDFDFISQMGSRRLSRFFERERQKIALDWVRRISQETICVMRAHRQASRRSKHLRTSVEARLLFYYLDLRLTCAGLALLIWVFGPHRLVTLAARAGQRSRLIEQVLAPATTLRVASPGNRGG